MTNNTDPHTLARQVGEKLCDIDHKMMALLGITLQAIEPGKAVAQMTVREDMVNSHGYCQGGLVFTLADHAFAYACMSGNQAGVTQSAHVIFSSPAKLHDVLTATATITSDNGGRTALSDVVVSNQTGTTVAHYRGINHRTKSTIV